MKNKSNKDKSFIEGLHKYIITHPQFRKKTNGNSETQIQAEIRPLIIRYLGKHFEDAGYKEFVARENHDYRDYWKPLFDCSWANA